MVKTIDGLIPEEVFLGPLNTPLLAIRKFSVVERMLLSVHSYDI
jgi:hypothetical protein